LKKTHVIITRPLESSKQLADQLRGENTIPVVMPFYSFSSRQPELDFQSVWEPGGTTNLAVFTSPRAVEFGLKFIPGHQFHDLKIAVIGSATRLELEKTGHSVDLQATSGFTTEDFLEIPELASGAGNAVIFCAPDGRAAMEKGLKTLGWNVALAKVYQRDSIEPTAGQLDQLLEAEQLISLWTSISAIKIAEGSLPSAVWEKIIAAPMLVISTRIQHYLQQHGARYVQIASGPGNSELLSAISQTMAGDWN
jgi:uroporphyrinogen-III synthase